MKTITFENLYNQTRDLCKSLKVSVPRRSDVVTCADAVADDIISFITYNKTSKILTDRAFNVATELKAWAKENVTC